MKTGGPGSLRTWKGLGREARAIVAAKPHRQAIERASDRNAGDPLRAYTRNGMTIDIFDDLGIQKPDTVNPLPFEAGWTEAGAVCIAHPRVPENGLLAVILAANPQPAGRIGPDVCTEAAARAWGAGIFNCSPG